VRDEKGLSAPAARPERGLNQLETDGLAARDARFTMSRIEVFADIVCPFTHVGLRRLSEERHARGRRVSLRIRAWPLEWINGTALGPELLTGEIDALRAQVAPEMFVGFDPTIFPITSIPAFGLVAAAYALDYPTGAAVGLAVRDALFEHGQDVSDEAVLLSIGRRFDVEPLEPKAAELAVRTDWERGKARAVQGSPHFFVGDRGWFCPSLEISHHNDRFDIHVADEQMDDFYTAAFAGSPSSTSDI
jgi:predicted DsbA family dithiol-disulfide isomerase